MKKNNSGVSLMTLIVAIVVMLILVSMTIFDSVDMVNKSSDARDESVIYKENEAIRKLLTETVVNTDLIEGIPLQDGILEVREVPTDEEPDPTWYGTNYYLIPGGDENEIAKVVAKTGDSSIVAYKGFTGSYVVDYYTGDYKRIEEIEFR